MKIRYPPQIYGNELGSWAHTSVIKRLPEIADRVINENDYPSHAVEQLIHLRDGIPNQPIRSLTDRGAPDSAAWEEYLAKREGKKWLEVPWFFVEHYFYRRILKQ